MENVFLKLGARSPPMIKSTVSYRAKRLYLKHTFHYLASTKEITKSAFLLNIPLQLYLCARVSHLYNESSEGFATLACPYSQGIEGANAHQCSAYF